MNLVAYRYIDISTGTPPSRTSSLGDIHRELLRLLTPEETQKLVEEEAESFAETQPGCIFDLPFVENQALTYEELKARFGDEALDPKHWVMAQILDPSVDVHQAGWERHFKSREEIQ